MGEGKDGEELKGWRLGYCGKRNGRDIMRTLQPQVKGGFELFLQSLVPPSRSMFLTSSGVTEGYTVLLLFYSVCFMLLWCTFYATIITHPHKWQFSYWKIRFANIHQCPVQAPVGMFMSAFRNSSNRHLSHLSKMLSFRFLSADAVSLGFV